ncbi:hypothetical protein KVT40_005780 [Elsinoe batatas]|uniref:Uncharacterized protein n=1 Tax=Elsinoe batatas TaxID=2601811 RepID=A0A8K0PCE9_9PEZI|nr:hypothetical protein KVT40_005780 [Elsinoe batatas]
MQQDHAERQRPSVCLNRILDAQAGVPKLLSEKDAKPITATDAPKAGAHRTPVVATDPVPDPPTWKAAKPSATDENAKPVDTTNAAGKTDTSTGWKKAQPSKATDGTQAQDASDAKTKAPVIGQQRSTPIVAPTNALLSAPPFIIKAFLWKPGTDAPTVEANASLTSQILTRNRLQAKLPIQSL